jgi:acetate kinase
VHCAVFDTTFHHTMPREAQAYAGPYQWLDQGIRRYGFHGINYQYVTARLCLLSAKSPSTARIVACHLGNGASIAAIHHEKSQDTTMGFTPLDGLMMGTRSGAIDPSILLYLLRDGMTLDCLERMLQKESGLLGISGISSDMRAVLDAAEKHDERAMLAVDMFVHRLAASIAAMTSSIGGIDILAFTGGIGEHAPLIRERVCTRLAYLGIHIDSEKNFNVVRQDRDVATEESAVEIYVIRAEEDWTIACEVRTLVTA